MGLMIKSIIGVFFFMIVSFSTIIYAAWEGPTEVVSGGWGTENGQFGISYQDTADLFPNMIVINSSGKILIGDSLNKRIQVFNADGTFSNIITPKGFPASYPPVIQWPLNLFICGDSNIYTSRNEYDQIYSISGELNQNFTTITAGIVFIDQRQCNFYTYNPSTKTYSLYSPTGQLIRTTTERPLELGKVSGKKSATGYTYTVQYPDITNPNTVKTYTVSVVEDIREFKRDSNGNIYGIATAEGKYTNDIVYRYDINGNFTGKMQIPETQYNRIPIDEPTHPIGYTKELIAEYGSAVISPTGDVYTWKRTPDRYSIIKWTWRP